MKGWVGLVGWPVADGLPTLAVTHQLQVERRTGKVRQSETDVLPLCHATNYHRLSAVWWWNITIDRLMKREACGLKRLMLRSNEPWASSLRLNTISHDFSDCNTSGTCYASIHTCAGGRVSRESNAHWRRQGGASPPPPNGRAKKIFLLK